MRRFVPVLALASLFAACEDEPRDPVGKPPMPRFTEAELKDPENCRSCHKRQYDEWSMSMHAYASKDPVFIAMNKKGQRETNGELGEFCVQCHAPMAVRDGLTKDGLNIDKVEPWAQGVTCYFCHNANGVGPTHANADITLAKDDVMRGSFEGVDPGPHGTAKSSFHDPDSADSSRMCGTCHDVVNQLGVHIERTYAEYQKSMFSLDKFGKHQGAASCQACHMPGTTRGYVSSIAMPGAKMRELHDHSFPAVDVALTEDFPHKERHFLKTKCMLDTTIQMLSIEVEPSSNLVTLRFEHDAGHHMPSGTAQDRRLWVQLEAFDEAGKVFFESGTIGDDEVEELPNDPRPNKIECMYRDHFKRGDEEVHMFWEAEKVEPHSLRVGENLLTPHVTECKIRIPGNRRPARVEAVMKMRPIGIDVMQSLVASGDLEEKFIAEVPTFELSSTHVEWRSDQESFVNYPVPLSEDPECEALYDEK